MLIKQYFPRFPSLFAIEALRNTDQRRIARDFWLNHPESRGLTTIKAAVIRREGRVLPRFPMGWSCLAARSPARQWPVEETPPVAFEVIEGRVRGGRIIERLGKDDAALPVGQDQLQVPPRHGALRAGDAGHPGIVGQHLPCAAKKRGSARNIGRLPRGRGQPGPTGRCDRIGPFFLVPTANSRSGNARAI